MQYIGDGYPLCQDLPAQLFLHKGATYTLLGNTSQSRLLTETWISPPNRVSLSHTSSLAQLLCNEDKAGECNFHAKVVLDDDVPCDGLECSISDPRVVEVVPGVWYEYTRPPCVQKAFFSNPQKISTMRQRLGRHMCADPDIAYASTSCCSLSSNVDSRDGVEIFSGEHVTYETAEDRCNARDMSLCTMLSFDDKDDPEKGSDPFWIPYWTSETCKLAAKLHHDGSVAIVHDVEGLLGVSANEHKRLVNQETKSFFRVDWISDPSSFLLQYTARCETSPTCHFSSDGYCLCDVEVQETGVFMEEAIFDSISVEDVLARVPIGAPPPTGEFVTANNVKLFHDETGVFTKNTVIEISDNYGRTHFRKNLQSIVRLGDELSFRNPVHFISISTPHIRDARYEIDATLEHFFYHPNTAPFLAARFAQRFGMSNPSPRYVETIAKAFTAGSYRHGDIVFGSGQYGCMKAMVAAVILDQESQSSILDVDPSQ